jgi:hypothetical protein
VKYIIAFGRFWYDFIVGDSAVLAVGGVAVLLVGWALARSAGDLAATILLPLVVIATLAASLLPARR